MTNISHQPFSDSSQEYQSEHSQPLLTQEKRLVWIFLFCFLAHLFFTLVHLLLLLTFHVYLSRSNFLSRYLSFALLSTFYLHRSHSVSRAYSKISLPLTLAILRPPHNFSQSSPLDIARFFLKALCRSLILF